MRNIGAQWTECSFRQRKTKSQCNLLVAAVAGAKIRIPEEEAILRKLLMHILSQSELSRVTPQIILYPTQLFLFLTRSLAGFLSQKSTISVESHHKLFQITLFLLLARQMHYSCFVNHFLKYGRINNVIASANARSDS
jgi:hypothetical protein